MKIALVLWLVVVSCAIGSLSSCGSSSAPAGLSIQLSPSSASLAVNSSVAINAQTEPALPKYYASLLWSIQGYTRFQCGEVVGDPQSAPPMSGCPKGWLALGIPIDGLPTLGVYYYAAGLPGTYTVVVQGQITAQSSNDIEYQGSATVPVTVTTQ